MKFKVGDKVRETGDDGRTGIVRAVCPEEEYPYNVDFDGYVTWVREWGLLLAEDEEQSNNERDHEILSKEEIAALLTGIQEGVIGEDSGIEFKPFKMEDLEIDEIIKYATGFLKSAYKSGLKKGYEDGKRDAEEMVKAVAGAPEDNKQHDRDYKDGLEDGRMEAWTIAGQIIDHKYNIEAIFGDILTSSVFEKFTADEAIARIADYKEKQRKELETIKIGDEVERIAVDGDPQYKYVVVELSDDGYTFTGISPKYGSRFGLHLDNYHRTGRHFDQIDKVLRAMSEE